MTHGKMSRKYKMKFSGFPTVSETPCVSGGLTRVSVCRWQVGTVGSVGPLNTVITKKIYIYFIKLLILINLIYFLQ